MVPSCLTAQDKQQNQQSEFLIMFVLGCII